MLDRTDLPPWDRAVTRWLARYNPLTARTYRHHELRWRAWCGTEGLDPWTIRRGDVEAYLAELRRAGLAEATIALAFDACGSLYRFLFDDELLERDPTARIRRPVIHKEGQRCTWLNPLEFAAFRKTARAMGPDAFAVASIGGMMGLRSAEMCQLDVGSVVDLGAHRVLQFVGKGGKPAAPPIPPQVGRAVDLLLAKRTDGALLRTQADTRFSRASLGRLVTRIGQNAGIGHPITPHGLRRTFATTGLSTNISQRDMMAATRHSRSESLAIYDMDAANLDRHASYRIAAFLAGFGD